MEDFIKPPVRMVGEDGNAFAIIGRVSKALKGAGYRDKAKKWQAAAMSCDSYDALLGLVFEYADVDADDGENHDEACCSDDLDYD